MRRIALIVVGAVAALLVLFVGFIGARYFIAVVNVESMDSAAGIQKLQDLGTTSSLTVLPLYENAASADGLQTGGGVSYLVQTDQATILFDVGNNPTEAAPSPLEQNMQQLGIKTDNIAAVVISHKHPDHTGGAQAWNNNTLSFGRQQVDLRQRPLYVPELMSYPGSTPVVATSPARISAGIATMGTLPFTEPFPITLQRGQGDEQSLAVNVQGAGIVVITGCGHPGLEKIVRRAQALFNEPVVGMIGGLHYTDANASSLASHIQFLQTLHPRWVALSPHDSGTAALDAFRQAFPGTYREIKVGQPIRIGQP